MFWAYPPRFLWMKEGRGPSSVHPPHSPSWPRPQESSPGLCRAVPSSVELQPWTRRGEEWLSCLWAQSRTSGAGWVGRVGAELPGGAAQSAHWLELCVTLCLSSLSWGSFSTPGQVHFRLVFQNRKVVCEMIPFEFS